MYEFCYSIMKSSPSYPINMKPLPPLTLCWFGWSNILKIYWTTSRFRWHETWIPYPPSLTYFENLACMNDKIWYVSNFFFKKTKDLKDERLNSMSQGESRKPWSPRLHWTSEKWSTNAFCEQLQERPEERSYQKRTP